MCLRIYLNGDGTGRGSHLSLFFVVMRGHSDALLKWPFNQKVKSIIVSCACVFKDNNSQTKLCLSKPCLSYCCVNNSNNNNHILG